MSNIGFRATARGRVTRKNPEQPAGRAVVETPVDEPAPTARQRPRRGRAAARAAAAESTPFASAVERRRNTPETPATSREPNKLAAVGSVTARRRSSTPPRPPRVVGIGDERGRAVPAPQQPGPAGVLGRGGEDVESVVERQ